MVVGNVPEAADFVVVGAGPGGYEAALSAAKMGRRVMLIDEAGEEGVGGVCLNVGCIPSKALIELSERFHFLADASAIGLNTTGASVDMSAFQKWKRSVVHKLSSGVAGALAKAKVSVRKGRARLISASSLVINDGEGGAQFVDFKDIVLATGSRPTLLKQLPVDGSRIVDSTGALAFDALPKTVAVVGGGYIGLELGMALSRLGAKVSVVEASGELIPSVDSRLVGPVSRQLKALGVDVYLNTLATGADDTHLTIQSSEGEKLIAAEKIVVAVGRTPNTDDLGLEDANIPVNDQGLIEVALDRRVSKHIAAIGDITPGPALAHKASAESFVAVDALNGKNVAFEPQCIPAVVFTDPEIATVGLTEREAKEAGYEVSVSRVPLGASGRAATMGATLGYSQLVADKADGTVLGVHLVGPHASELIAEAALAIELGASAEDVSLTIHPHPTLSEQIAHIAAGV